jgi:hypothetical protein
MNSWIRILQRAAGASCVTAMIFILGFALMPDATAQQKPASMKDQIVGTWKLVSGEAEQNGKKVEFFGPDPIGIYVFDANGRYSSQIARADLPKFASGNRYQGTPEENKAVVQGFIAYFGTYTVSDEGALTLHMVSSSFPNFNGTIQTRTIAIKGDEMDYRSPSTSFGAPAHQVWRRVRPDEKLGN